MEQRASVERGVSIAESNGRKRKSAPTAGMVVHKTAIAIRMKNNKNNDNDNFTSSQQSIGGSAGHGVGCTAPSGAEAYRWRIDQGALVDEHTHDVGLAPHASPVEQHLVS